MTVLRRAVAADAVALAALKLATFRETFLTGGFAIPYPPADLAAFEAASYAPGPVAAGLADPAQAAWVVEDGAALVAYAQVGPCKLPHPEVAAGAGELYQLYVARTHQGQALGNDLLAAALAYLADARPGPVWLGAWEGNSKAHRFYAAHGFVRVGGYGFPVGGWTDQEYIFRRG